MSEPSPKAASKRRSQSGRARKAKKKLLGTADIMAQTGVSRQVIYTYADAEFCRCLYAGTERARRRYERLRLIRGFVQERRETAEAFEGASMNLGAWGPWYPWH